MTLIVMFTSLLVYTSRLATTSPQFVGVEGLSQIADSHMEERDCVLRLVASLYIVEVFRPIDRNLAEIDTQADDFLSICPRPYIGTVIDHSRRALTEHESLPFPEYPKVPRRLDI